jgi:hypothetical protein
MRNLTILGGIRPYHVEVDPYQVEFNSYLETRLFYKNVAIWIVKNGVTVQKLW